MVFNIFVVKRNTKSNFLYIVHQFCILYVSVYSTYVLGNITLVKNKKLFGLILHLLVKAVYILAFGRVGLQFEPFLDQEGICLVTLSRRLCPSGSGGGLPSGAKPFLK